MASPSMAMCHERGWLLLHQQEFTKPFEAVFGKCGHGAEVIALIMLMARPLMLKATPFPTARQAPDVDDVDGQAPDVGP